MKKIFIFLFVFTFPSIFFIVHFSFSENDSIIKIPAGTNARGITRILRVNKLITNEYLFLATVLFTGNHKNLKSGTYKLNGKMFDFQILKILVSGPNYRIRITIPEGFTSRDIAKILAKNEICNGNSFLRIIQKEKLEGYLFPETYIFEPNISEEKITEKMVGEFWKNFKDKYKTRADEMGFSINEIVTLASIIEKEAKKDEERGIISGIFHNRLKKRWNLESCATVLYAIGEHKEKLTYKDLKIKSPYNTYVHRGLPPGPICNPGIKSIYSALYPEKTEDMFFVVGEEGTHRFSKYLQEHIQKKQKRVE